MRLIEKIEEYRKESRPFYSFEFFPPKTESGLYNLYSRLDRMASLEPLWMDVTWGAGGSTNNLSLELSQNLQTYFGVEVMMHLTCTDLPRSELLAILNKLRDAGITNILALRGDPPRDQSDWQKCHQGFSYAYELAEFIKENFQDTFSIAVGAYPEGHIETQNKDQCTKFLKKKFDSGAEFAVTQLFYDLDEYRAFLKRCDQVGIKGPIIPGILPIQNYQRFKRFVDLCQIKVPQGILDELEPIKNDDEKVQKFGIDLCIKMCKQLLDDGAPGLHFYTLNLENSVTKVLEELQLTRDCRERRAFPWRSSAVPKRKAEDVRPIFWSNRPKSYLARTEAWDDFPNGRWGDRKSPTFGAMDDYYLLRRGIGLNARKDQRRKQWGEPQNLSDIGEVFTNFCKGKIVDLPWCEMPVQVETSFISSELVAMNQAGMFTINSQPQVNGASSDDPVLGWGGSGGFVFQKAYVEFFATKERVDDLIKACRDHPSISYHAINVKGESYTNLENTSVNAVTWGVFPGKEIIQPTVVDSKSFKVWKDEAFDLWLDEWQSFYEKGSPSYELIQQIHDNYFLVNIVENNFVSGNVFSVVPR